MNRNVVAARWTILARIGAACGLLGGVLWSAIFLASLVGRDPGNLASVERPERLAFAASSVLLAVALAAAQVQQFGRVGWLGWAGFLLVETALAVAVGDLVVDGERGGFVAFYAYMFLLPIGTIPFATGSVHAGALPRLGVILVAVGSLGPLLGIVVGWNWAIALAVVFGFGWGWLARGLWQTASSTPWAHRPGTSPRQAR